VLVIDFPDFSKSIPYDSQIVFPNSALPLVRVRFSLTERSFLSYKLPSFELPVAKPTPLLSGTVSSVSLRRCTLWTAVQVQVLWLLVARLAPGFKSKPKQR
jgi:hypothetical protein